MEPKKVKKLRLADRVGLNRAPVVPEVKISAASAPDDVRDDAPELPAKAPAKKKPRMAVAEEPVAASPAAADGPSAAPTAKVPRAVAPAAAPAAAGRKWTVTVALPGSIVDNAQTQELRSYLVGQVARACAIFNVDEIVVFATETGPPASAAAVSRDERKGNSSGSVFMARVLQYLECPQYLRKTCFPHHPDLRSVGIIPPIDAPHHLRLDETCAYREAVVLEKTAATAGSCHVYTGLRKELKLDMEVPPGTRLTVRMPGAGSKSVAKAVAPREPREVAGLYWGYQVPMAPSLAAVWAECPHEGGYDVSIGTSEH